MYSIILAPSLVLLSYFISLSNTAPVSAFDTITDPKLRAEHALSTLQIWYDASTGVWQTSGWWNSANVMTMLGNLAKADPDNKILQDLAVRVFANTITQAPQKNPQPGIESKAEDRRKEAISKGLSDVEGKNFTVFNNTGAESGYTKQLDPSSNEPFTNYPASWYKSSGAYKDIKDLPLFASSSSSSPKKGPNTQIALENMPKVDDWLDGFYDDDLWWALAWINAFDVTGNTAYLRLAEGIFKAVTKVWPSKCGNGGIYWSWEREYVNAIPNELFFSTAAYLSNRVSEAGKAVYVDWAQKTLKWFLESGMMNEDGLINDGLTDDCKNNGRNTWSYNQGVILGGLVELNRAAPNEDYISLASRIANAAIEDMGDNEGVIHDGCEPNCGGDAGQFKGIFMRNLMILHQAHPEQKFADIIRINADSIWKNNRDPELGNVFSVDWAGPFVSPTNATLHSSAMDALVAHMVIG